jgi:hypothetical protein
MTRKPKVEVPKSQIEYLPPGDLIPNATNPRKTKRLGVLETSLEAYGFVNPIIAYRDPTTNEVFVVAGHQRIQGAIKRDVKEVPVIFYPFKSMAEARSYGVMDNRSAEVVADWDYDMLKVELEKIAADLEELNPETLGFNASEYEDIYTHTIDETMRSFERGGGDPVGFSKVEKNQKEDGNWFYVEYYGDDETFNRLLAILKPHMRTGHEIAGDAFQRMVALFTEQGK